MSLTELMSNAGLSRYAEVALLLFFLAFLLILYRVFRPSNRQRLERQAMLPLDDGHAEIRSRPAGESANHG
jgi:cbb3-type cytochrome oxidase subunit 3